jgi:hypothetical protein
MRITVAVLTGLMLMTAGAERSRADGNQKAAKKIAEKLGIPAVVAYASAAQDPGVAEQAGSLADALGDVPASTLALLRERIRAKGIKSLRIPFSDRTLVLTRRSTEITNCDVWHYYFRRKSIHVADSGEGHEPGPSRVEALGSELVITPECAARLTIETIYEPRECSDSLYDRVTGLEDLQACIAADLYHAPFEKRSQRVTGCGPAIGPDGLIAALSP